MNYSLRLAAMALLALAPCLVQSQVTKCPKGAPSDAHRQSKCDQAPVEPDLSTGSSDGLLHFSRARNDLSPTCRVSANDAGATCASEAEAAKRRCWQLKLSAACQAQTGVLRGQRDPTCEQQIFRCEAESSNDFRPCIHRELPPSCMEQVRASNRAHEGKN